MVATMSRELIERPNQVKGVIGCKVCRKIFINGEVKDMRERSKDNVEVTFSIVRKRNYNEIISLLNNVSRSTMV
jgi:hypothetical protein